MLTNSFSDLPLDSLKQDPELLVALPFDTPCTQTDPLRIDSGLELLDKTPVCELWRVQGGDVSHGVTDGISWHSTPDMLCASIWIDFGRFENIEEDSRKAYQRLLEFVTRSEWAYSFRFWNFIPDINMGEGDAEIYKRFCKGRHEAFAAAGIAGEDFPSASALGHNTEGAVIYVFAGKEAPVNYCNSRQVNAFEYPREYGEKRPSFARATGVNLGGKPYLFISGTASIIGHETVGLGDVQKQVQTTMENVDHLLLTANPDKLSLASMRVYVRHHEHYEAVKSWLADNRPDVDMVFIKADVCRSNLLVEIECFCC